MKSPKAIQIPVGRTDDVEDFSAIFPYGAPTIDHPPAINDVQISIINTVNNISAETARTTTAAVR